VSLVVFNASRKKLFEPQNIESASGGNIEVIRLRRILRFLFLLFDLPATCPPSPCSGMAGGSLSLRRGGRVFALLFSPRRRFSVSPRHSAVLIAYCPVPS